MNDASVMDDDSTRLLTPMNILRLTDFPACGRSFPLAVALARANQAKLSVLHVVVPHALTYMTPDSPAVALDIRRNWAQGRWQRLTWRTRFRICVLRRGRGVRQFDRGVRFLCSRRIVPIPRSHAGWHRLCLRRGSHPETAQRKEVFEETLGSTGSFWQSSSHHFTCRRLRNHKANAGWNKRPHPIVADTKVAAAS